MRKFLFVAFVFFLFSLPLFAKERINVAFCIDNNYPLYTMLVINSILLNNKSQSKYTFYIINNNLSLWNKLRMKLYVYLKGEKIEFIKVDTSVIDNGKNLFDSNEITKHVSRIGTARILLPKLLPKEINKVLYLDSDMLVVSDLKELYDISLDNCYAAMALDISVYNQITNREGYILEGKEQNYYYNTGMILVNLLAWRKYNLSDLMIDYLRQNNIKFGDQDALNVVLKNNIKQISNKYNNYEIIGLGSIIKLENSSIIHYITSKKPWINYRKEYDEYWGKSGLLFERLMFFLRYYYPKKYKDFINKFMFLLDCVI